MEYNLHCNNVYRYVIYVYYVSGHLGHNEISDLSLTSSFLFLYGEIQILPATHIFRNNWRLIRIVFLNSNLNVLFLAH